MKKLMIAAVAVCAAAAVQAAAFSWKTSTTSTQGVIYDGTGKAVTAKTTYGQPTFYLFDAAEYSVASAFADLTKETQTLDTSKAVSEIKLSTASKLAVTGFDHGEKGGTYTFYFAALMEDGNFYISATQDGKYPDSGATALSWRTDTESKATAKLASEGYKGAGWYTVPEPTSGLLLLLGVAGLALRRRRA